MSAPSWKASPLRIRVTLTATLLIAVLLTIISSVAAVFLREQMTHAAVGSLKASNTCLMTQIAAFEDPLLVDEETGFTYNRSLEENKACRAGLDVRTQLTITRRENQGNWPQDRMFIASEASYRFIDIVPELSLWPLANPAKTPYHVQTVRDRDNIVEMAESQASHDEIATMQRRLNQIVLLLIGADILTTSLVAAALWIATGRMLRPVEAIRREMADITESDLGRRVPVPKGRNEISALALSVNSTLDRLEVAVENHRRFVADASHELRSPIAALRTELEIATAHPEQADWPTVVAAALTDTENLQRLATDLLLLTRLDHATTTTEHADTVDVTNLVRRHATRRRSPHDLTTDLPDQPAPVRGSRALLERLLGNLLDNAERHATTAIAIRLTTTDDQAILEVLDDGPGIPLEDRDRVFDRFTRLDDARTRSTGGTGLGLPIARRIATIHGGTLQATDHPAGIGARLVAALPLAP